MRLDQLCHLQLGYTARGRLDPVEGDGVRAIQLRDTAPGGGLYAEGIAQYRLDAVPGRYLARQGDVLFRSRGDRNTATALSNDFDGPAVAVMPLVIIRPHPNTAEPDYLAWFINQPASQRYFDGWAQGGTLRMISISCLAKLEVALPDLSTQRAIAEVNQLADRERQLTHRLAERRHQLTALTLLDCARARSEQHRGASSAPRPNREGME
jgi:hypothetical protein